MNWWSCWLGSGDFSKKVTSGVAGEQKAACMAHLLIVDAGRGLQVEAALHREAEHAHHIEVLASCTA